jgi:hypothetical protein
VRTEGAFEKSGEPTIETSIILKSLARTAFARTLADIIGRIISISLFILREISIIKNVTTSNASIINRPANRYSPRDLADRTRDERRHRILAFPLESVLKQSNRWIFDRSLQRELVLFNKIDLAITEKRKIGVNILNGAERYFCRREVKKKKSACSI